MTHINSPGTALVTGAGGFVGRHFAARLRALNYTVVEKEIRHGTDCRTYFHEQMKRITPQKYQLVIHAAANVGGRMALDHRPFWVAENFQIDSLMFQWAEVAQPEHVVYFSSSAVYNVLFQRRFCSQWLDEDDLDAATGFTGPPDGTYGMAKLAGEYLANVAMDNGLRVHIVRPFSGYGEDQSTDYPFGALKERILRREDPFVIWGDGSQVRHWIHIDDVVAATLEMVKRGLPGPINLAEGKPITFAELARKFFTIAKFHPKVHYLEYQPTGVHTRRAKIHKLRQFYRPQITINEGITRALPRARAT